MANVYLTPKVLASEIVSLLIGAHGVEGGGDGRQHFHVDAKIDPDDMKLPLAEASARFLAPVAAMIAKRAGGKLASGLALPRGVHGAVVEHDGVEVRCIPFWQDSNVMRFDVLVA